MSASTRRSPLSPSARPQQSAPPDPDDGPERLRWLVRRITDDDRDAFAELFDRCSGEVARRLRRQVPDRRRAAVVFAGTFVEVWWLAGCHAEPDTDVMAWIDGIVRRRVADSRPGEGSSAGPASPPTQSVEVELPALLGRRHSTSALAGNAATP